MGNAYLITKKDVIALAKYFDMKAVEGFDNTVFIFYYKRATKTWWFFKKKYINMYGTIVYYHTKYTPPIVLYNDGKTVVKADTIKDLYYIHEKLERLLQ